MAEPLLATQCGVSRAELHVPRGVYRCAGDDEWVAIAVSSDAEWRAVRTVIPERDAVGWLRTQSAADVADRLRRAGVPAAALANSLDLVHSEHLRERGFWDTCDGGVLPGLPWRTTFARTTGAAPGLGAETDAVLAEVVGLSDDAIAALRATGALG
jgi:crotonobetainyl-CoA:carnitine CoA-transferase CaiB-like acyl-CoA transferase